MKRDEIREIIRMIEDASWSPLEYGISLETEPWEDIKKRFLKK